MKKRISFILAVLMSVSILSSCSDVKESKETLPPVETITQAETLTTPTETEITESSETEATTSEQQTTATEETTTVPVTEATEETTTAVQETTAQTEAKWSETEVEKKLYISTTCYSRKEAIVGSKAVDQYKKGSFVNVIAKTDTGYYKLKDGSFIHSDYLTDEAPTEETKAPVTEKVPDNTTSHQQTGNSTGSGSVASTSYKVDYKTKYGYKKLSSKKQDLYGRIVKAVENLDQMVEVPDGLSRTDIIEVYMLVFNEEPQLFWMGSTIPSGSNYLMMSYKEDDPDKIKSMQASIDRNVKGIINTANNTKGTFGKLKVFFDWIIKDAEFALDGAGYNSTIYNGLGSGGYLQCAGYAKSMKYLCDLAGIPCIVVVGSNEEGDSHAWNVVYCDNGWYNLDATWGDPMNSFGSDYIQYEFFLVPDAWIHNKTHFNINKKVDGTPVQFFTPPACTQTSNNYFNVYNKTYSSESSAEKALYSAFDKALAGKKNVVEIRVTSRELYDKLVSDSARSEFTKYLKDKSSSVKGIMPQKKNTFGVLVVHYNVYYN